MIALLQILLYAPAPFFCYPHKPFVNYIVGDGYETAYKHFRRDHSNPTNLALHGICLIFQLLSNFALLVLLDKKFTPSEYLPHYPIATFTALMWTITLLTCNTPVMSKILSAISIGCAHTLATKGLIQPQQMETYVLFAFVLTMFIGLGIKLEVIGKTLAYTGYLFFFRFYVEPNYEKMSFFTIHGDSLTLFGYQTTFTNALYFIIILMCLASASKAVPIAPVAVGAIPLRLLAIFSQSDILFLLSCGFVAPLMQGCAHSASNQAATLILLNKQKTTTAAGEVPNYNENQSFKIKFEFAHVTFFPALAFHSILQSLGLAHPHSS